MAQKHTSADTSINSTKVPTGFRKAIPTGIVFDYGCGKFPSTNAAYCYEMGATEYIPYDPYNSYYADLDEYTAAVDTLYCTNVLNVIDNDETIEEIIHNVMKLLAPRGRAIFTVYEGNGTGEGRETKPDCWQTNKRIEAYIPYFQRCINSRYHLYWTRSYIILKRMY